MKEARLYALIAIFAICSLYQVWYHDSGERMCRASKSLACVATHALQVVALIYTVVPLIGIALIICVFFFRKLRFRIVTDEDYHA